MYIHTYVLFRNEYRRISCCYIHPNVFDIHRIILHIGKLWNIQAAFLDIDIRHKLCHFMTTWMMLTTECQQERDYGACETCNTCAIFLCNVQFFYAIRNTSLKRAILLRNLQYLYATCNNSMKLAILLCNVPYFFATCHTSLQDAILLCNMPYFYATLTPRKHGKQGRKQRLQHK